MTISKKNLLFGFLIALFLPIIVSPLVANILYWIKYPDRFFEFSIAIYKSFITSPTGFPVFLSLCAVANLPVFFYLLKKDKEYIARGIIIGTLIYAIIYFYLKLS